MMFERFTERARQVIVLSQEEARTLKHNYIGTEHLLLGLLREEEGSAARVLAEFGLTADVVRSDIERIIGRGEEATQGQIPFTPRAKKVCELALRESLSLGHNYIGTEHILLGMVRENEGVGARVLTDHDIDSEKVRNEVARMLSSSGRRKPAPPKKPKPAEVAALRPHDGLTRVVLKSGQGFSVTLDIENVMEAVWESAEGLIGFRCLDDRMRYFARDQIALIEPDPLEQHGSWVEAA